MSSSLLLPQCPACLARLICIVFVMGGRCPYSCCFVGCCLQDLFNAARIILLKLPSRFFSIRLVVHPYSSIDTAAAWKKRRFFYRRGLTPIWPIPNRQLCMPFLVACWCHFSQMRCCFWGWWNCPPVSENHYFVWSTDTIGPEGRVFTNGLGDLGSIPGRVIRKTLKMVLDTSLLNTQQYKERIT